jgi:hypothetical protein
MSSPKTIKKKTINAENTILKRKTQVAFATCVREGI